MALSITKPPLDFRIIPALQEDEPILANMLELYIHDFGEFVDVKLGADGRFGYPHLQSFFSESDRHPFIIRVDDDLAGFAFVCRGSRVGNDPEVWDMAEFFIVRGFRRLGLGTRVAHEIWKRFPGKWEVRVIDQNRKAVAFWTSAIGEYLGEPANPAFFEKNGSGRYVFSFESHRQAK